MAEPSHSEKDQLHEEESSSGLLAVASSLQDTISVETTVIPETYEMMNNLSGIYATPTYRGTASMDCLNQLRDALYNNDYDTFENIVKQQKVQLDYVYGHPDYKSCLEIAVSQHGKEKFIKLLLEQKVNVNKHNKTFKSAPIHFAIETGNLESLKVLLEDINLDINIKKDGDTPLLQAIMKMWDTRELAELAIYEEIIKMLLGKGCNLNTANSKGVTPIYAASKYGLHKVVTLLLGYAKMRNEVIDLDTFHDRKGKRARDYIREKIPSIYKTLSAGGEVPGNIIEILFSYLYKKEEDNFIRCFTRLRGNLDFVFTANNGTNTMLTLATEKGLEKVVDLMLLNGINPNDTYNTSRPIAIACRNGYLEILKRYLAYNASLKPDNGDSLIQIILKEMPSELNNPKINHKECLKLLLATKKIDINYRDGKNNTALHYAARNRDNDIVLLLLRNGACIGLKNQFNEPALADINVKTLETYMNECITIKYINDEHYEVHINYNFLIYQNNTSGEKKDGGETGINRFIINPESTIDAGNSNTKVIYESEALSYMAEKERYQKLLLHPVISSFLYLKWQRISCIFYVHIIFYLLMYIFLMLHIVYGYNRDETQTDTKEFLNILSWCNSILGLCFLILRELFQMVLTPVSYIKRKQNWMELILIMVITYIICFDSVEEQTKKLLSVIVILLSSLEIVILVSNFPTPSTYFVMLKKVTQDFIKFIMWYFIIIVAFALSFFTLFRPTVIDIQNAKKNETNFFGNLGLAIFKNIIMITGEFETGNINFDASPVTSHILFIIFIFIVPITLFNLLNGLAVNDIQNIRQNAKIVRQIMLIEMCLYFEKLFVGSTLKKYANLKYFKLNVPYFSHFTKRINLFPDFVPKSKIILKTIENNIIVDIPGLESTPTRFIWCCFTKCRYYRMTNKIIQAAKTIHYSKSEYDEIKDILKQSEKRLKQLEVFLEKLNNQVETINHISKVQ